MPGDLWVSVVSLGGVVLGGALSFGVQHHTQRSAERAETQAVMHRVWVAERLIRLTFPLPVHEAARAYFLDLNAAVWDGPRDWEDVRDGLEASRLAFLDAARTAVG